MGGNFLFVPEYLTGHLTGLDVFTCQRYTGMDGGNKTYSGSHYFHYIHFNISINQPEVAFPNYLYLLLGVFKIQKSPIKNMQST